MEEKADKLFQLISTYGLNLIAAAVIFVAGRWAVEVVSRLTERILKQQKVDETLAVFTQKMIYYGLMTFVVVAVLGKLGIQTASFVAVIGATGLAIGLALQGSLSNFAAGVLIIIFRPFSVGDVITAAGTTGKVAEIEIFNTVILPGDGIKIVIPNSQVTGTVIQNFTELKRRRVDLTVGVSYKDDLQKVKKVLQEVVNSEIRVLKDPAPVIAVSALADSSVNLVVRPWVLAGDYWDVYFALTGKIKESFDKDGISIPYPQREVHVYQHSAGGGGFTSSLVTD